MVVGFLFYINQVQNSSPSLALPPRLSAMRLRIKIQKTYQACLCKFFCFKAPGLKEQHTAFTGRDSRAHPKGNLGDSTKRDKLKLIEVCPVLFLGKSLSICKIYLKTPLILGVLHFFCQIVKILEISN